MTYGCHNRAPLKTRVVVQDGWFMDGVSRTPHMVSLPNPMTKDCQFTHTALGKIDKKCTGCAHKVSQ